MSGRDGGTVNIQNFCGSAAVSVLLVPALLYFLSPSLPLVQYEQKQLLLPFYEGVKLSAKSKQFFHQWCSRFMTYSVSK